MRTNHSNNRRALIYLIAATLFFTIILPVFAQSGFSIVLYTPDIDEFPKVTLFLDAYDGQGKFISGLDLNSFTVFEDGFEMPVNETQILEPGLHTIVAFNLGATLSNRENASLPTRFETAVFDLATWLNGLESSGINQYSLTSNEGILVEKLQEKDAFTFQLQNYKPNLFNFEPNLTSLSLALDIAEKPNLITQSKQSILYITPLPLDSDLPAINNLIARAADTHVPVNVWLMAPDTAANAPAAAALNQLAVNTGGRFYLYTEESAPPNPEETAGLLRSIYRIRYTSNVSQGGAHSVRVKAMYGNQESASPEIPFSIDLTLPSAVFIDLPGEINRQYMETGSGRVLQPEFVTLQAEVIFPDGYSRQLEATRLYVDGKVIAENKSEPFNFFAWPLESYAVGGENLVSVEVEDILGFRSLSPPQPVRINVESLYPDWLSAFMKFFNRGGWILFATLGLGITILASIRIRRRAQFRDSDASSPFNMSPTEDPLLQNVPGVSNNTNEGIFINTQKPIYSQGEDQTPVPFLKSIGSTPIQVPEKIDILEDAQIIGSVPNEADIILAHPSIQPRHARVQKNPSGNVTIADLHSTTGTWVNYTPISTIGTVLKEGDLIRMGEFSFRYHLGLT